METTKQKYLTNTWYAAALSTDLGGEGLFKRTLLDIPVIMYRKADGTPVALHDRCPRITSYNVCYTKSLRSPTLSPEMAGSLPVQAGMEPSALAAFSPPSGVSDWPSLAASSALTAARAVV